MIKMSRESLVAFIAEHYPDASALASWITDIDERGIRLRCPFHERQIRPGGTLSGPTMMLIADTAMYFMLLSRIGPQLLAVTSSLHIDFLRKPAQEDLFAVAEPLRIGRRLAVGRVIIHQGDLERPMAHATVTYAIPDAP